MTRTGRLSGPTAAVRALISDMLRLGKDRRGVAAIEFAFIAPLLFIMYFVTLEMSQGIEASKKLARTGSTVTDLVGQLSATTTPTEIDAILDLGSSSLLPYARSQPTITVSALAISTDNTPVATITWSRRLTNGTKGAGETKGAVTSIPADLLVPGTSLIRVQTSLGYLPVITWTAQEQTALGIGVLGRIFDGGRINMGSTYYIRARVPATMSCPTC